MNARATGGRRVLPGSPFNRPEDTTPCETFEVGDQVSHDRHGLGKVVQVTGGTELVADFRTTVRRIQLPCAKLAKL